MSLGIPGTSIEASLGGGGSVWCLTAISCPPSFLSCFGGCLEDLGSFKGLGADATCPPRPASTLPAPRAARPAAAAVPPSTRKLRRSTAIPPSEYASLDLTAGDQGPDGPAAGAAFEAAGSCVRSPEARSKSPVMAAPAASAPAMVSTVGTGAANGSASVAAAAIAASTTTPIRAEIGDRRARFASSAATISAPMVMVMIRVGISAVPRISMPLVTSSPGVSSTTRWASDTNTEGTNSWRRPWTSSASPNATTAPTTPEIPALNLVPIAAKTSDLLRSLSPPASTLQGIYEQRMNAGLTFHTRYDGKREMDRGPSRAAQREAKPRAVARAALDADLTAVGLDQAARYRE